MGALENCFGSANAIFIDLCLAPNLKFVRKAITILHRPRQIENNQNVNLQLNQLFGPFARKIVSILYSLFLN